MDAALSASGSEPMRRCGFIPPYLLQRLAVAGLECATDTLAFDHRVRSVRGTALATAPPKLASAWVVHSAGNTTELPGTAVRGTGEVASGDIAVDEAATGIEATLALFQEHLGRDSYDGKGASVSLSVHYGTDYDNAFWDGAQLVFGDGDGQIFDRFTKPVDVLAHEFTHAVTEYTAGLVYSGQSGALNESVSDAFASCLKQRVLGQSAEAADWLIGEGIFLAGVRARALRDLAHPGTAYDDPRLGKDPQVGSMSDYRETSEDDGGVHLNSGIPNRAFQLAAVAIGGDSIDGAGAIWYRALIGGGVHPSTDFSGFAAATIAAADIHADAVRSAWAEVGVEPGILVTPSDAGFGGGPGSRKLTVRRTGGFAGMTTEVQVDLDSEGPGVAGVRDLLGRITEAGLWSSPAESSPGSHPDGFTYVFQLGDNAPLRVREQDLTPPFSELAEEVLRRR